MRALLAAALTLVSTACFTQKDCKFIQDEVDEFTKARLLTTEANIALNMYAAMHWKFRYVDGRYILTCRWTTNSIRLIDAGASLMVMLSNDSILTFSANRTSIPEHNQYYDWVWVDYEADLDRIAQMGLRPVVKVRIYLYEGYIEFEVDNRRHNQEKIQKAARCLTERAPTL